MKLVLPAMLFTTALVAPAHAYLDPGTGSMILQAIVGGIAVVGATLSVYWVKVKSLFTAIGRKKQ